MSEPNGRATKTHSAFRMECAVAVNIKAAPKTIWLLLTNAAAFPHWNSTVTSIEGEIALGNRLVLRTAIAPTRTFKPKVIEFHPEKRMVWAEGVAPMFRGWRCHTLTQRNDGTVDFSMVEVLSGLMLPMIKGSLPDFGPSFEHYAADLKRETERRSG